jgi:tetratricopeptide (TPR) repeat protein
LKQRLSLVVLLSVLSASLSPSISPGAEFKAIQAVCPVSGHDFFGLNILAVNTLKHRDGDFLLRAEGGNQYATWIWSCPYCFFSARPEVFSGDVAVDFDPSSIEKARLSDATREGERVQLRIPSDIKFRNAASYYYAIGKPPYFLGVLYLHGSWAVRMEKVSIPPGYIGAWWKSYMKASGEDDRASEEQLLLAVSEDLEANLKAQEGTEEELKLSFLLASTLRQAGEHHKATPILREVLESSDSRDLSDSATRELELAAAEAAFQTEALRYFKEALQFEETLPEDRLQSIYLVGELSRRLGDYESAEIWFAKAEENPMPQRWARTILQRQMKLLEKDAASLRPR